MSNIDWSKAPEGYPIWIESLTEQKSDWHRDEGDAYVDRDGREWTKPEEGFYVVHLPPAPWTGEGLPPVGTVCEAYDYTDGKWVVGKMLMHGNSDHAFASGTPEYWGRLFWACEFRPASTPEQIAAEEREKAIAAMVEISKTGDDDEEICAALYDAGYRKTEAP